MEEEEEEVYIQIPSHTTPRKSSFLGEEKD